MLVDQVPGELPARPLEQGEQSVELVEAATGPPGWEGQSSGVGVGNDVSGDDTCLSRLRKTCHSIDKMLFCPRGDAQHHKECSFSYGVRKDFCEERSSGISGRRKSCSIGAIVTREITMGTPYAR